MGFMSMEELIYQAISLEALEKQIEYEVDTHIVDVHEIQILNAHFMKGTKVYKCKCGMFVSRSMQYCVTCGQKLKFSN